MEVTSLQGLLNPARSLGTAIALRREHKLIHIHRPMAKTEANMELSYSPDLGDTPCLPDQATGQGQGRGPSPLSVL